MECVSFFKQKIKIVILHRVVGLSTNRKKEFYKKRRRQGGPGYFTTEVRKKSFFEMGSLCLSRI
jgi:hypothetical protein